MGSGGDFNEIFSNLEKKRGRPRQEKAMRDFREVIDWCAVRDPSFIGPEFTWCNNHVNSELIWERLDHFLLNMEILDHYSIAKVLHLPFLASDHKPILAKWTEDIREDMIPNFHRPKRFEEAWARYEECHEIVQQVWHERRNQVSGSIIEKSKICLARLRKWSQRKYGGSIRGRLLRKRRISKT